MPPPVTPPGKQQPESTKGIYIAFGLIGLVVLLASLGKCSEGGNTSTALMSNGAVPDQNISAAVAAQSPPPVVPLSGRAVRRGGGHFRLANAAEGMAGAVIYSKNCYDALGHQFSWVRLDTCGGFDMAAVAQAQETAAGGGESEDYFANETAAGRYLSAATAAGEAPDKADQRLSQLQAAVARRARKPEVSPAPDHATNEATPAGLSDLNSLSE